MNVALITYSFLFDPGETWAQLSSFEQDLNAYFNDRGMEARVIQPLGSGNKIIHITRKEEIAPPVEKPKGNTGFTIRAKGRQILDKVRA